MSTADVKQLLHLIEEMRRESYEAGWRDAVDAIASAARDFPVPSTTSTATPKPVTPDMFGRAAQRNERTPVIYTVLDEIHRAPGRRGADVLRDVAIRTGLPFKTVDRTGRTSLSRLKNRGKIHQDASGAWYPGLEPTQEAGSS